MKTITLITNGTLLTEKFIDELAAAGLTMLNISLNAIDPKIAKLMEGHGSYDVEKVKKMAAYAAKTLVGLTPSCSTIPYKILIIVSVGRHPFVPLVR